MNITNTAIMYVERSLLNLILKREVNPEHYFNTLYTVIGFTLDLIKAGC